MGERGEVTGDMGDGGAPVRSVVLLAIFFFIKKFGLCIVVVVVNFSCSIVVIVDASCVVL